MLSPIDCQFLRRMQTLFGYRKSVKTCNASLIPAALFFLLYSISTVFTSLTLAVFVSFSNLSPSVLLAAADSYPCGWANRCDSISLSVTSAVFSLDIKHL